MPRARVERPFCGALWVIPFIRFRAAFDTGSVGKARTTGASLVGQRGQSRASRLGPRRGLLGRIALAATCTACPTGPATRAIAPILVAGSALQSQVAALLAGVRLASNTCLRLLIARQPDPTHVLASGRVSSSGRHCHVVACSLAKMLCLSGPCAKTPRVLAVRGLAPFRRCGFQSRTRQAVLPARRLAPPCTRPQNTYPLHHLGVPAERSVG